MRLRFLFLFLLLPCISWADTLSLDLGATGGTFSGRLIQMMMVLGVLALAPSIVVMVTSFTRFVIVFSFVRTAIGTQQSPPNMVLISLAIFLTAFVMGPTLETVYKKSINPLIEEQIDEKEAFKRGVGPIKTFMLKNVREKDLKLFLDLAKVKPTENAMETPLRILVPSFIISELRRAFEIGFLLFVPFLIIDLIIASLLMAMGMMMLPPVMIALPFKIIFFVLVDGWHLLCGSLINGVNV